MVVGLPTAGISALFYLLCVLLMPVRTAWLIATGQPLRAGHWRLLMTQSAISLGIVAVLFLTGWVLTLLLPGVPSATADGGSGATDGGPSIGATVGILSAFGLLLALSTLATVMGVVQLLAWRAGRQPAASAVPSLPKATPSSGSAETVGSLNATTARPPASPAARR